MKFLKTLIDLYTQKTTVTVVEIKDFKSVDCLIKDMTDGDCESFSEFYEEEEINSDTNYFQHCKKDVEFYKIGSEEQIVIYTKM